VIHSIFFPHLTPTCYSLLLQGGIVQSVPCTAAIFWSTVLRDLSSNHHVISSTSALLLQRRHLVVKQGVGEKCPWIHRTQYICTTLQGSLKYRKIIRHGADGFTSPLKEGVLRIFIALKNPSLSAGFEPANRESNSKHAMKPSRVTQLTLHQVGEIEKIQQQRQSTTNKWKVNTYFKVEAPAERQWLFRFRSFRLLRRVHLQPWRWKRYVRPKLSYLPTISNGGINEKTNTDKCPFITGW
jgi:hypothetical protein